MDSKTHWVTHKKTQTPLQSKQNSKLSKKQITESSKTYAWTVLAADFHISANQTIREPDLKHTTGTGNLTTSRSIISAQSVPTQVNQKTEPKWFEEMFEGLSIYREAFNVSCLSVVRNAQHCVAIHDLGRMCDRTPSVG